MLITIIVLFNYCHAQDNYSLKELNNLLTIEYVSLKTQEKLLDQNHNNENVKKAIEITITHIKKRIEDLEEKKLQNITCSKK